MLAAALLERAALEKADRYRDDSRRLARQAAALAPDSGMQHRAAFARALITRPSLLLMDEPFGALDAITRARMQEFLLSMREQYQFTIVFVTHDIEEAVLLGDRVAVMGGRPPGIREIIDVPLRRPRHAADADTTEFITAKRRIRASLTGRTT